MIISNNTSADIKTKSADVHIIENDHDFEWTEDQATVSLKNERTLIEEHARLNFSNYYVK